MPWPMPALRQYEIIYTNKYLYQDMDVLYYLDADMLVCGVVGNEFLPIDVDLVGVLHPGYTRDKIQTFERRKESTAYVNQEHHLYHCGAVQGGKTDAFLNACKELMDNINNDYANGIIAVWHDESHWNAYLVNTDKTYKSMDSSYCYPESWKLDLPKKILALDKNHSEMRT